MTLQMITRFHNQMVIDDLEEGDLIEINRGLYSHWAIYNGKLIISSIINECFYKEIIIILVNVCYMYSHVTTVSSQDGGLHIIDLYRPTK